MLVQDQSLTVGFTRLLQAAIFLITSVASIQVLQAAIFLITSVASIQVLQAAIFLITSVASIQVLQAALSVQPYSMCYGIRISYSRRRLGSVVRYSCLLHSLLCVHMRIK